MVIINNFNNHIKDIIIIMVIITLVVVNIIINKFNFHQGKKLRDIIAVKAEEPNQHNYKEFIRFELLMEDFYQKITYIINNY